MDKKAIAVGATLLAIPALLFFLKRAEAEERATTIFGEIGGQPNGIIVTCGDWSDVSKTVGGNPGHFSISGIEPGIYVVTFRDPADFWYAERTITLSPEQQLEMPDVFLDLVATEEMLSTVQYYVHGGVRIVHTDGSVGQFPATVYIDGTEFYCDALGPFSADLSYGSHAIRVVITYPYVLQIGSGVISVFVPYCSHTGDLSIDSWEPEPGLSSDVVLMTDPAGIPYLSFTYYE